jgi:iron complex transport system ATP-binding protein
LSDPRYVSKIIEIKNVTAYRGDTRVFDGLSLEIPAGRNTVILGPNGAGKTTLLKLLMREIYPVHRTDSHLRIFGRDRWNVWELRARLGIVSQDLQKDYVGYASGMNVILSGFYSSVDVWAHQQFSDADIARAERIIESLGIAALKNKLFAAMSTGEQRRFLLGRALVNDPETLVLDEPTSGLDLRACFQYIELVRGLMQNGKTVILVTHHIHEIPPEIEYAILLKNGEVMAEGRKIDILTDANLSNLFATSVHLVQANGFYQAMPAAATSPRTKN